ncbi:hypothetical protein BD779DRAFT_1562357 [Infundibulicybe gibba]|nr:hypothetical protein BD779DRAFT_1562357 [Infundibulicybe gibba]
MLLFRKISPRIAMACSLRRTLVHEGGGPGCCRLYRGFETSIDVSNTKPVGPKPRKIRRVLSTLDPRHLQPSDFTDLSDMLPTFVLPEVDPEQPGLKPNTRGFFYYHRPPGLPFTASGVRFRVTPSKDPSLTNFEAGKDLLFPFGLPWQISFPSIVICSSTLGHLRDYLLRCGAITQSEVDTYRAQFGSYLPSSYYTLHTLDQPFPISFGAYSVYLVIVGSNEIHRLRLPFSDPRMNGKPEGRPYRGLALAQLRPSTLPEHAGRDVLVMQILKIVQPVTCAVPGYDGYMPQPEEGALLHHRSIRNRHLPPQPWICDLDDGSLLSLGLRALRDVSPSRTLGLHNK